MCDCDLKVYVTGMRVVRISVVVFSESLQAGQLKTIEILFLYSSGGQKFEVVAGLLQWL